MPSPVRSLNQLLFAAADSTPDATLFASRDGVCSYAELADRVGMLATGLGSLAIPRGERVAVCLPKSRAAIEWLLATSIAGLIAVPVNPVLKARQVRHVLRDSRPRLLVGTGDWLRRLTAVLAENSSLSHVITLDQADDADFDGRLIAGEALFHVGGAPPRAAAGDDTAVLFYTSGSTGLPKGVMVSHENLTLGAESVVSVHGTTAADRILALLPLSFDAGFSQLTTALCAGASLVLADHLLSVDTLNLAARHRITHLTGVPPLFRQLVDSEWPESLRDGMRSFASTGGVMPVGLTRRLQELMPNARGFLMYGFTEAFRATILPPEELERRPDSMGRAIPGADLYVLRQDTTLCRPGEAGELVQAGRLVSQGYWGGDAAADARFRPLPAAIDAAGPQAVWSGDIVHCDEDGFFYFHYRDSLMIKTSGYRVSPDEVENVLLESGLAEEAVVVGTADPRLGESILALVVSRGIASSPDELAAWCRRELPPYLCPAEIRFVDDIPRSPNGKYDRQAIRRMAEQEAPF